MRALFPLVLVGVAAWPVADAHAHSGGRPGPGCVGCHGGGDVSLSITTSPTSIDPGDLVTVTLLVDANGFGDVAGVFVGADTGELDTIGGQGLAAVAAGLTHSQPKSLQGGVAEFEFLWTAPNSPGAVRFDVSVLAGNGNGSSSGDRADEGRFDFVYGCEGQSFWLDFDADGYGRDDAERLACAGDGPLEHAAASGDCDDTRNTVHPDAIELCNQRDDDCDEAVDEDAVPIPLFPDGDGDGYYGQVEGMSEDTMMGCVGTPDYAGEPGDCEPNDATRHPGAEEVCNLYDDNCDGRADERVRPICGVGWCAREAWTCDPTNCDPGEPQPETCNLLDDDCNDLLDDEAECPDAQVCIAGECRAEGSTTDDTGATTVTSGVGESGGGSSESSGAAASPGSGGRCAIGDRSTPRPSLVWALVLLALSSRTRARPADRSRRAGDRGSRAPRGSSPHR